MDTQKLGHYAMTGLRFLLALLFLLVGAMKLIGTPMVVTEFEVVGLGQWFRYFVGTWEVVTGITLLLPAYRQYGAVLAFIGSVGAFLAQIGVLHQDWIHTVVLILISGGLVYSERSRLLKSA